MRHLLDVQAPYGTYNVTNGGEPTSWAAIARGRLRRPRPLRGRRDAGQHRGVRRGQGPRAAPAALGALAGQDPGHRLRAARRPGGARGVPRGVRLSDLGGARASPARSSGTSSNSSSTALRPDHRTGGDQRVRTEQQGGRTVHAERGAEHVRLVDQHLAGPLRQRVSRPGAVTTRTSISGTRPASPRSPRSPGARRSQHGESVTSSAGRRPASAGSDRDAAVRRVSSRRGCPGAGPPRRRRQRSVGLRHPVAGPRACGGRERAARRPAR